MVVKLLPGNKRFLAKLDAMKAHCADLMPAFIAIDQTMMLFEYERFEQEGPGWAPLADPATTTRKKGMPYQEILQRGEPGHTQGLMRSLTTHASGSLFAVTPHSLTMGTRVTYAKYHQKGDPDRGMPARPPWPTKTEFYAVLWPRFKHLLEIYIVNGAK